MSSRAMAGYSARSDEHGTTADPLPGLVDRSLPALSVLMFILLWWLVSLVVPPYLIPSPLKTLAALGEIAASGELSRQILTTLFHVLVGSLLSVATGSLLGVALGLSRSVTRLLGGWVPVLQAVPGLAWSLMAIVWFGLSPVGVIFVVCIGTLPTSLIAAWEGIKNVEPLLVDMAKAFGASRSQQIGHVYLPAITPSLLAGSRIAFGLAWKTAVVTEIFMSGRGIGSALYVAAFALRMDLLIAWTIVLVISMTLLEQLGFRPLERTVMRWRAS